MKAYHGTSASLFETFSLDHALEGSGKAKFGFGVYFTEKYGTTDRTAAFKSVDGAWGIPVRCAGICRKMPCGSTICRNLR